MSLYPVTRHNSRNGRNCTILHFALCTALYERFLDHPRSQDSKKYSMDRQLGCLASELGKRLKLDGEKSSFDDLMLKGIKKGKEEWQI